MFENKIRSWAKSGTLSHTGLIWTMLGRYTYVCISVPITFLVLRRFQPPIFASDIANWFFPKLGAVWPALIAQQDEIRQSLGSAEAIWYALFFFCLVAALLLLIVRMLIEMHIRRADLTLEAFDLAMLVFVPLVSGYLLLADFGGRELYFEFVPDGWGYFYFRQYLNFVIVAWLVLLFVFYVTLGLGWLRFARAR